MELPPLPATLCVGFRPIEGQGGAARLATLQMLKASLFTYFEDAVIADDGALEGPYNRSKAKNNAAATARTINADPDAILVFADADTYVPQHQAAFAVAGIRDAGADIVMAHNGRAQYLASGAIRGVGEGGIAGPFPGGCFAIRRSAFEKIGGFDEEFVGWGHEDICFFFSADRIFGLKIMRTDHPAIGPVVKLDLLHPRVQHESELMNGETSTEEAILYARNTRRRDAYFALNNGDEDGYWKLRGREIE